jgi:serine/threonine-protein kinase
MDRLREESEKLRALEHEGIVRWLDQSEKNGTFYLVEALVRGGRMMEMYEHAPPTVSEGILLMRQLAKTTEYLAKRTPFPIIHGDICPLNVMIRDGGQSPVLIDFGIATRLGHDCAVRAGTRPWSAPEQMERADWRLNSDVYALGASFFFLATGLPPPDQCNGRDESSSIETALERTVVHEKLRNLIIDCLKVDPEQRIQSTSEMLDQLDGIGPPRRPRTWENMGIEGGVHPLKERRKTR